MTRTRTAIAAVAIAVLGALGSPHPARADDVADAQSRVDRLQHLVELTTFRLTQGTQQWEADQAKLRSVQLDEHNAEQRVAATQQQITAYQARMGAVARHLYMSPEPAMLQLALTQRPSTVVEALQAQHSLDVAAGSDAQVVAHASAARLQLQRQQQHVQQLADQARALVSRSAKELAKLQALAQRTAAQLDAAQANLAQARAALAARLAREARARADRLRALQALGGAACTGRSTAGQANGNLDPASLCPLWKAPGQRLRYDAAPAFNKLSQYHAATLGTPLCVTDSYRSYSQQVAVYHEKPGLAAVPGTSEHGWGKAVDLCGGVQDYGSPAFQWMKANAGRFGFFHPAWAEPSGSKPEPWHWEFNG